MDKKSTFIASVKTYEPFIYKLAAAYTYTNSDRQDLIQEILYQLWKSYDSFQGKSDIGTWIYRVALNVSVYYSKKESRKLTTIPIDESMNPPEESSVSEREYQWQLLQQHLEQLSLLDRGIILLYLEDKSYEAIAEITGLTKTNVGTRLQRIREKLKYQIQQSPDYGTE